MADGWAKTSLELLKSRQVQLTVTGVALFVLGAARGIQYKGWLPIDPSMAYVVLGAGVLTFVLSFLPSVARQSTTPRLPKVSINTPAPDQLVTIATVRGTIKGGVPTGYEMRVFRVWPGREAFVPLSVAVVDAASGTWHADKCDIGGELGDIRYLAAWLVGPEGAALLDYYAKAVVVHNATLQQLQPAARGAWLPPIDKRTSDMIECARVRVRRGTE